MQVEYILDLEDILHSCPCKQLWKKPTSKPYYKYSMFEMLINKVIVLLWGGESFDSYEGNRMLMKHRQAFKNSHRVR